MNQTWIDSLVAAIVTKNLEQVHSLFTEDEPVYDPHYPVRQIKDKAAMRQEFEWGLGNMEMIRFQIHNCWMDGD